MEKEPLLHEKRIWASKNATCADTRGDIYVWPRTRGHFPRHLLIDVVVTAPADSDKRLGDAAARGSRDKFKKYSDDWAMIAKDPTLLAFAMEPTGFVAKPTDIKLKNLIREVLNVPIPRGNTTTNTDESSSPPIYRYFLNQLRASVSLALARGTARMLLYARGSFRVVHA
jgi:hypothetical protein